MAAEKPQRVCLDRSSRPHRSPRLLRRSCSERICDCRRKTGWGPRLVAGATGFAHSTVWKVLKRAGLSRPPRAAKEPANRYEWPCPGDLLHMDVSRYARFLRPGHRVTGDRSHARATGRARDTGRLRLRARDRRRPLPARLRRAPRRRESRDRHRLPRARARLLRRARHRREAADDRQRLQLRQEPLAARAAQPPRHPAPHDRALPATHQRQSRTLPPDDGTRMGLRPQLPLTSTPQPALPHWLNHYNRRRPHSSLGRPATNQPRSQRPWVGQLEDRPPGWGKGDVLAPRGCTSSLSSPSQKPTAGHILGTLYRSERQLGVSRPLVRIEGVVGVDQSGAVVAVA